MAQIPYNRHANFVSYETANPTTPKRGTDLDAEFDAIEATLDGVQSEAAKIQRADGALANAVVTLDSLTQEVLDYIKPHANEIAIDDAGNLYASTEVEGALQEVMGVAKNAQTTANTAQSTANTAKTEADNALSQLSNMAQLVTAVNDIVPEGHGPVTIHSTDIPFTDLGNKFAATNVDTAVTEAKDAGTAAQTTANTANSTANSALTVANAAVKKVAGHLPDGTGNVALTAADIPVVDAGAHYAGTNAESVLQEVGDRVSALEGEVVPSVTSVNGVGPGGITLDASQIPIIDAADNYMSSDVEGALTELANIVASGGVGSVNGYTGLVTLDLADFASTGALAYKDEVTWGTADMAGVPLTFPPDAHTHASAEVTGLDAALANTVNLTGAQDVSGVKTFTANPVVSNTNPGIDLRANASGGVADVAWRTGTALRWLLRKDLAAESGSNAGSSMSLYSYNDAGVLIGAVFTANRASRVVDFALAPTVLGSAVWHAGNFTPSNYLPLSGGTMTGNLNLRYAGNAYIEIGRVDGVASTPLVDFHSGATATDFDSRIVASGGDGTSGGGSLRLIAANIWIGSTGTNQVWHSGNLDPTALATGLNVGNGYPSLSSTYHTMIVGNRPAADGIASLLLNPSNATSGGMALVFDSGADTLKLSDFGTAGGPMRVTFGRAGGISLAQTLASSPSDLSKQIQLWAGYGFSITSSTLNYNAGTGAKHSFLVNGVEQVRLDTNGVSIKNANSTTMTAQPRTFVQSADPGAAAADGDLWIW